MAERLGARLNIPAEDLDALHWEANWTEAEPEVFRARVDAFTSGTTWVLAGNYKTVRDIIWSRIDTVVWLDFNLWVVMTRLVKRTFQRIIGRVELWNGNQEQLKMLFSKDSIFLWALQTHRKNQDYYIELTSRPEYAHLHVVRLRTPRAADAWLAGLGEEN
jgi:adenylate kinase family enzyme